MISRSVVSLFAVIAATIGCADARNEKVVMDATARSAYALGPTGAATREARDRVVVSERGNMEVMGEAARSPADAPPPAGGQASAKADVPASTPRKIIYSADVDLVVENFPKSTDEVAALVNRFGGYIADTDITGSTGSHRRGNWKVRVPIERFESFLDAVVKLGELQRRQIHSQDVTEEFYDLSARIKNKKVEEGRLVKHLEESTGKLKEILDVEREISRVREEVERMEGRIRLLANLTDLTTVTITVDERVGYVPATAPSFGTRASRTLDASVKGLRDFCEGLALLAISIVPWLPFWIVGLLVAWFLIRRLYRRYPAFFSLPRRPRPA